MPSLFMRNTECKKGTRGSRESTWKVTFEKSEMGKKGLGTPQRGIPGSANDDAGVRLLERSAENRLYRNQKME